jgi:hypothetical protein
VRPLLMSCGLLSILNLVTLLVAGWVAYGQSGANGLLAATVAAGVCWLGALSALLVTGLFGSPRNAVSVLFGSMLLRLGLPMVAGMMLSSQGGLLARSGVFGLIVVFYLINLPVETWFSLRLVGSNSRSTGN